MHLLYKLLWILLHKITENCFLLNSGVPMVLDDSRVSFKSLGSGYFWVGKMKRQFGLQESTEYIQVCLDPHRNLTWVELFPVRLNIKALGQALETQQIGCEKP